jgi:WD40 repeat protein/tetratricopeptide (TPR) repeat protein
MSEHYQCPQGHQWDSQEKTTLTCPYCAAVGQPMSTEPQAPAEELTEPLPDVPGYEVIRVLGRGGMGVVYWAWQQRLNRSVALKMLLTGELASHKDLLRFRTEAEAAARLHHPNIAQVYDIGEFHGLPYLSLEYVDGGGLDEKLDGTPWPATSAAELIATLARAMHFAHEQGVIHRDLKPANILLTREGVPKITDFGLAKISTGGEDHTRTGAILGSPSYMAPEQAAGQAKRVGPTADVYALGSILYLLLTGQPPFKGESAMETVFMVLSDEPVAPSRLRHQLSPDLETICLKCLEKDPGKRYATAEALADDLGRFLKGEPIAARPVGRIERTYRWCRRNPVMASLLALVILALLGGSAVSTYFGFAAWERAIQAEQARDVAQAAQNKALVAEDQAKGAAMQAQASESRAIAAKRNSDLEAARLKFREAIGRAEAGAVDMGLYGLVDALKTAPTDAEIAPFRRVIRTNFAAWSQQLPILRYVREFPAELTFRPIGKDGKHFVAWRGDRDLRLYETSTGQPLPSHWQLGPGETVRALSPDGTVLLTRTAKDNKALLQLRKTETGEPAGPACVMPDPNPHVGSLLLGSGQTVLCNPDNREFWDLTGGKRYPFPVPADSDASLQPVLTLEGKPLAVVYHRVPRGTQGMPRLEFWDLTTGKRETFPIRLSTGSDERVGWNGRRFLTQEFTDNQSRRMHLIWWDLDTGQRIDSWQPRRTGDAWLMLDSQTLTVEGGERIRLFDLDTGLQRGGDLSGPKQWTHWMAEPVTVVGQPIVLVNIEREHLLRAWNTHTLARQATVAADPRTRLVAGALGSLGRASFSFDQAAVLPGGKFAFMSRTDRDHDYGRLVEIASGQPIGPVLRPQRDRRLIAFSPDGGLLATAPHNYSEDAPPAEVHIHDVATGRLHVPALAMRTFIMSLAFSPDSQTLAVGQIGGNVLVDVHSGKIRQSLRQQSAAVQAAFSPDGQTLAVAYRGGWDGTGAGFRLWSVATGQPLGPFHAFGNLDWIIPAIHMMDQGRTVLALETALHNRLWAFDGRTGTPIKASFPQREVQRQIATRLQDAVFAFKSSGGTIEQWDLAAGRPVGEPLVHPYPVYHAEYSPDGSMLATSSEDNSVRLWDSATGLPLGPPLSHGALVRTVRFVPDRREVITVSDAGETQIWPLRDPVPDDPDRLTLWIDAAAGCRFAGTETALLDPATWQARCRLLEERWPEAAAAMAKQRSADLTAELTAWHESRLRGAESTGNTFALLWHLDFLAQQRPNDWHLDLRRGMALADVEDHAGADAAFTAAARKGAGNALLDCYAHGAALARSVSRWQQSLWYLDRLLAARSGEWQPYVDRAEVYGKLGKEAQREADLERAIKVGANQLLVLGVADECAQRGKWQKAAGYYERAEKQGPLPLLALHHRALICLQLQDLTGYRQACARLVQAATKTPLAEAANLAAWTCALGPGAVEEFEPVLALAERALAAAEQNPKARHDILNTVGAVLCRAGRHKEALARLDEGIKADNGSAEAGDWLFLALAYAGLGETAAARKWLEKVPQQSAAREAQWFWNDLEMTLLRREVEARLKEKH